jgi:hypothetical protein
MGRISNEARTPGRSIGEGVNGSPQSPPGSAGHERETQAEEIGGRNSLSAVEQRRQHQSQTRNSTTMKKLEEWQKDCLRAVDDSLVRDLVSDFRRGPPAPGSPLPSVKVEGAAPVVTADEGAKHRGWAEPRPLAPPPGSFASMSWDERAEEISRRVAARAKREAERADDEGRD